MKNVNWIYVHVYQPLYLSQPPSYLEASWNAHISIEIPTIVIKMNLIQFVEIFNQWNDVREFHQQNFNSNYENRERERDKKWGLSVK